MLSILHLSKSFKLTWCWASIFARTISITFSSWNDWKTFDDSIIFWNGLEAIFFNSYVKPLLWISWHGPWWPCCGLWMDWVHGKNIYCSKFYLMYDSFHGNRYIQVVDYLNRKEGIQSKTKPLRESCTLCMEAM